METGDKALHHPSKDISDSQSIIQYNQLVINVRYDGLTIVVIHADSKEVIEIFETTWLAAKDIAYLIDEIEKFLEEHNLFLKKANAVHWVLSLSRFILVPDIYFDQENSAALLKKSARLEESDVIYSDFWPKHDAVSVYAVPGALRDFIFNKFEKSTIAHCGHNYNALYQLQSYKEELCLLHVSAAFAELFIVKEGKLQFFNQFGYDVNEDILYYLLFALEQNRIPAPEVELKYSGKMQKGDELYKMLITYIGKVEEIELPAGIKSSVKLTRNQLRRNAHLIANL